MLTELHKMTLDELESWYLADDNGSDFPSFMAEIRRRSVVPVWQLIETAPKDGSQRILIAEITDGEIKDIDFDAEFVQESESWEMPEKYWLWKSAFGRVEEPTHWAPFPYLPVLPIAPEDAT